MFPHLRKKKLKMRDGFIMLKKFVRLKKNFQIPHPPEILANESASH